MDHNSGDTVTDLFVSYQKYETAIILKGGSITITTLIFGFSPAAMQLSVVIHLFR